MLLGDLWNWMSPASDSHLLSVLLLAMFIDLALGGPQWLGRIPGPETGLRLIIVAILRPLGRAGRESGLRRLLGAAILIGAIFVSASIAAFLEHAAQSEVTAFLVQLAVVTLMLGQRHAWDTTRNLAHLLSQSHEDDHARDRAALWGIERLINRYSDGLVANAFYYLLFGLPGLFIYRVPAVIMAIGSGHGTRRPRGSLYDAASWFYQLMGLIPAAIASLILRFVAFLLRARRQPLPLPPSRRGDIWIRLWPLQAAGAALGIPARSQADKVPSLGESNLREIFTLVVIAWVLILAGLLAYRLMEMIVL